MEHVLKPRLFHRLIYNKTFKDFEGICSEPFGFSLSKRKSYGVNENIAFLCLERKKKKIEIADITVLSTSQ